MSIDIKSTSDLRQVLLDTINKVRSNKIGTKEASVIATLSAKVMQSAELDLKATRYADQYNGALRSSTPLISNKAK